MMDHERAAKTGREGDLRFLAQPDLGPGDLGGVYPLMNWYSAWFGDSRAMGGMTPLASQVSRMTFFGCPAFFSGTALA
jgi:hypothetical protein